MWIGVIMVLLGTFLLAHNANKYPSPGLVFPYMVWGFIIIILGILMMITGADLGNIQG